MEKKIVIALGGNALGNSPREQIQLVKETAKPIVKLAKKGYEIILSHGNGPQIGMLSSAFEFSSEKIHTPEIPFTECCAMTQGYIGYHLQQAISNELKKENLNNVCLSIVTQIIVDKNDEAFNNPTKPIGSFYSKEDAEKISREKDYLFMEDAGRGYRRVVASPKPQRIIELDTIKTLSDEKNIVIAAGGGGIPVIETDNGLEGIPSVIDKDLSSAKMALDLDANILLILTAVEKVSINFNKPNQIDLSELTVKEIDKYILQNEFAKGSMLPKIEACKEFILNNKNKNAIAIITSLDKATEALEGKTGTVIKI